MQKKVKRGNFILEVPQEEATEIYRKLFGSKTPNYASIESNYITLENITMEKYANLVKKAVLRGVDLSCLRMIGSPDWFHDPYGTKKKATKKRPCEPTPGDLRITLKATSKKRLTREDKNEYGIKGFASQSIQFTYNPLDDEELKEIRKYLSGESAFDISGELSLKDEHGTIYRSPFNFSGTSKTASRTLKKRSKCLAEESEKNKPKKEK